MFKRSDKNCAYEGTAKRAKKVLQELVFYTYIFIGKYKKCYGKRNRNR